MTIYETDAYGVIETSDVKPGDLANGDLIAFPNFMRVDLFRVMHQRDCPCGWSLHAWDPEIWISGPQGGRLHRLDVFEDGMVERIVSINGERPQ